MRSAVGIAFLQVGEDVNLTICVFVSLHTGMSVLVGQGRPGPFADVSWQMLQLAMIVAIGANLLAPIESPSTTQGWVGIQTHVVPSKGNFLKIIKNNQSIVADGLGQGKGASVVIFPEAVLNNWWPGTRQQLARAVPPGQVWLIGAQAGNHDAVVMVFNGHAAMRPVTAAAGLLLGGDWQPWNARTLRPVLAQPMFTVEGKRAWAALCVEQVLPWTWLEAMWQRPDEVLAMSNDWWATSSSAAPGIQAASTKAWARLMGVPVVWAQNR